MDESQKLNGITDQIIKGAIQVHKTLGPGLLESTYETCLAYELLEAGLTIERQKGLPVIYRGVELDCGYRLDLLVEDVVIVEIKSVARLEPVHEAQILSYLKLANKPVGLLINFNVTLLKHGLRRIVNQFPDMKFQAKTPGSTSQ